MTAPDTISPDEKQLNEVLATVARISEGKYHLGRLEAINECLRFVRHYHEAEQSTESRALLGQLTKLATRELNTNAFLLAPAKGEA